MDRYILNSSGELGKLVDTVFACSPTPVIQSDTLYIRAPEWISYQSNSVTHCSLRSFSQSDVIP